MKAKLQIFWVITLGLFLALPLFAQLDLDNITTDDAAQQNQSDSTQTVDTATSTGTATQSGTVQDVNSLNVRKSPWGTIVGTVHKGDSIKILGTSDDNKWFKIEYKGSEAYVWKSYIKASAATTGGQAGTTTTPVPATRTGKVTVSALNVRNAVWGTVIGTVRKDQSVTIKEESQGWFKIDYNGKDGWVSGKYISISQTGGTTGTTTGGTTGGNTPSVDNLEGQVNGNQYGYNAETFGPVLEEIKKFTEANEQYVLGKGHIYNSGYLSKTDCSGFTAQFYLKLAKAAGVTPVIPDNSWTPVSTAFKGAEYTKKITSEFPPPNPRDLIRPGDIFVMDKKDASYGHIGVFVGYNSAGEPLVAHSSSTRINSDATYGNAGKTGVRIEPMPRRYQSRYAGMYRFNNMDEILNKLKS